MDGFSMAGWIFHFAHTISDMIRGTQGEQIVPLAITRGKETPMHDSRTVANRFLELAGRRGDTLTPMQLLKLVYIAHGWMLGLYGRALIRDEVQAWQYGPVIPRLYNAVKDYRGGAIARPISSANDTALDEFEEDIISQVYGKYGEKSGPALSRITHAAGTPWQITYVPGEFGTPIPQDIIEDHYRRLALRQ
jgi:uncharacterized phage-associated protein